MGIKLVVKCPRCLRSLKYTAHRRIRLRDVRCRYCKTIGLRPFWWIRKYPMSWLIECKTFDGPHGILEAERVKDPGAPSNPSRPRLDVNMVPVVEREQSNLGEICKQRAGHGDEVDRESQ